MEDKYSLPIILFDNKCQLCIRFKDSLLRLEGARNINAISIYDQEVYEKYPMLSEENCRQEVHFVDEDSNVYAGEKAIEKLILLFPLVRKFSWLIESNMGKKAIDYFHTMTDKYRRDLKRKCPNCVK